MDNFFPNCPAMMSGRDLGDYKSETRRNEYIKYINDIWRDDQYRLFLQMNGKEVMDREWQYYRKNQSCWVSDCVHNYPTRMLPRHFVQERQAYDSINNPSTNKKLEHMRQCKQYNDFRMTPDSGDYKMAPKACNEHK